MNDKYAFQFGTRKVHGVMVCVFHTMENWQKPKWHQRAAMRGAFQ